MTPVILEALFTGVIADTGMAGTLTVPGFNVFIWERLCPAPSEGDGELAKASTAWSGSPCVSETLITGVKADTGLAVTYPPTPSCAECLRAGLGTPCGGSDNDCGEMTAGHCHMFRKDVVIL